MDEIRKNQEVSIELRDKTSISGVVRDYSQDRVCVQINDSSIADARKFCELDIVLVSVSTHIGIKKMFSHVLDEIGRNNCIVIENNEPIQTIQRRQYVRVYTDLKFKIRTKDGNVYKCTCKNISGGGIAFLNDENVFELNQEVVIIFPKDEFEKHIECKGIIIKDQNPSYAIQFKDVNSITEGAIIKYVYKLIAKK